MKRTIAIAILVILIFVESITVFAESDAQNWYCTRNKDHKQPRLDSRLDFVEKYDLYWIDKAHSSLEDEKVIYLTFDAGYENGNVAKVLDVLEGFQVQVLR